MNDEKTMNKLLVAVVQSQDSDLVSRVLEQAGFQYGKLPSAGGFLRERNVSFLIPCPEKEIKNVQNLVGSAAKRRISYLATPIDNAPFPIMMPAETVVGGASFFQLDLDYYEEF